MAKKEEPKKPTESTAKRVIDCKGYVELGQPKTEKFGNSDQSINSINIQHTHRVVEHLALT